MYRVLTCLTLEHDWRLVVLGGVICLLASAVAISLFHRARAAEGRAREIWIGLDAAVGGCGIWATHFVAMLAYDPGIEAGYNIPITLLSLVLAVAILGSQYRRERAAEQHAADRDTKRKSNQKANHGAV